MHTDLSHLAHPLTCARVPQPNPHECNYVHPDSAAGMSALSCHWVDMCGSLSCEFSALSWETRLSVCKLSEVWGGIFTFTCSWLQTRHPSLLVDTLLCRPIYAPVLWKRVLHAGPSALNIWPPSRYSDQTVPSCGHQFVRSNGDVHRPSSVCAINNLFGVHDRTFPHASLAILLACIEGSEDDWHA